MMNILHLTQRIGRIRSAKTTDSKTSYTSVLGKSACAATLLGFLVPLVAVAAEPKPMTGDEFSSYTTGRMLTFIDNGEAYGAEQYLPNNRVRWAFDEETCLEGVWFEHEQSICFVYEDGATPECWQFFQDGNKLKAIFEGINSDEVYEAEVSDGPLACTAPGLGA